MDRPADENPQAVPPVSADALSSEPATPPVPPAPRKALSGDAMVAILLGLGIILAATAWLWHYEYRRVPQTFWGFESPKIFRDAKEVTAYLIRPEGMGVAEKPMYYDSLFMIDELRFVVVKKKDISKNEGLPRIREALNNYRNYQQSSSQWSSPNWRFALEFHFKSEDPHMLGDYTAMIVFDADCKLGRPQSVNKVISTDAMSAELTAYFEGIFPEAKELKTSSDMNVFARPLQTEPEATPTATSTATGDVGSAPVTTDSERLTTPHPIPSSTVPTTLGPTLPSFDRPSGGAFATPEPAAVPAAVPTATSAATVATPAGATPTATGGGGPSIFSTPPKVGPAVVPQMPGIPGLPGLGGPAAGPLAPAAPAAPGGLNINLNGGTLTPPSSPLYQGAPQPGGALDGLTAPTPISVPALQGGPKPSGTK